MPSLAATAALDHGIGEYRLNVLQHVVSDDPDLMATLDTEIGDRQRALQAAFDAYSQYAGSSEGRALYDELGRSEEHTSELQSLMRISYAVFCLKKKNNKTTNDRAYKNKLRRRA